MHRTLAAVLLLAAAGRVEAQATREWQIQGVGAFSSEAYVGGGAGLGWRTAGRTRVGLSLSAGALASAFAARAELMASYHLDPYRQRGVTPYAAGGLAVTGTAEGDFLEHLVLLLGVESTPGRRAGWFVEAGVGGGARVSLGVRFRQRATAP